jgi:hypothetical protein
VKAGEVYEASPYPYPYDETKVTLLRRVPDGFDPECNMYRYEVEVLSRAARGNS